MQTIVVVALALASSSAWAQQGHDHKGLYLRLGLGAGYASFGESDSGGDSAISGGALSLDMDIGGFVQPNFAVGLDLSAAVVPGPSVRIEGMDLHDVTNAELSLVQVGIGLTYFWPESNAYGGLSAGLALAEIKNTSTGNSARSQNGLGMNLLVGKEWWASPHWGIGVAGRFFFMAIPDTSPMGSKVTANAFGGGVVLSSSYSGG